MNNVTKKDDAKEAVEKDIKGPKKRFGYRAMTQKLRTEYSVYVHHHLVHKVMCDVDPDGNEARQVNNKIKKKKQSFT